MFSIEHLPEKIINLQGEQEESFEYIAKEFKQNDDCVNGSCSIFGMLIDEFSHVLDDDSYEEYLELCQEEKRNIEEKAASYNVTDYSRVAADNGYCGSIYLNLYLVARR